MMKKNEIREQNKALRRQMSRIDAEKKSQAAAKLFLESELYKTSRQLMLYMPLGNEVDLIKVKNVALADGKRVVLPVTERNSGIITPICVDEEIVFAKGNFSVMEPQSTDIADMARTDVVLVPGIAFDKSGARVGFGKGCYDMLLERYNGIKIGVCYDFQLQSEIQAEEHDIKMDFLLTESGLKKCED
ncbi:MAG: 5-formyltetrahydrofolate cyclo-ligase [Ruminococcaceae bacterium]|nr:5-formyltetrahydrofolate cyclo-ligase [Oscillospiraceae bacterium]